MYSFHKKIEKVLYFKSWYIYIFSKHYVNEFFNLFKKSTNIYTIPWTRSYVIRILVQY